MNAQLTTTVQNVGASNRADFIDEILFCISMHIEVSRHILSLNHTICIILLLLLTYLNIIILYSFDKKITF